jgi:hypothetical protein
LNFFDQGSSKFIWKTGEFMKTRHLQTMLAVMAVIGLGWSTAPAQDSPAANTVQPAAVNAPVPQLSYGTPQILQLTQAKVGDDTIIAYIKNSRNSYGLNADQIIYLRQQGVSDAVITTMLNQPQSGVAAYTPATPAPQPVTSTAGTEQVSTATVAPTMTYVQPVPDTTYYGQPYYYPTYGWYPPVALSFGWGWGGGWGGGWHGGGSGGWHGGGRGGGWHR